MESFENLYEQYYNLIERIQESTNNELTTDLLQFGITKDYFEEVVKATSLLQNFYDKYLATDNIQCAINERLIDNHAENTKFCMLIDVLRCYEGLGHPTSFTTPEGIALMVLLGKVLGMGEVNSYEQLSAINPATLSLIDIIPYIGECSDELGEKNSLFMSTIFEVEAPGIDRLYRKLLYNLCKRIAEVDGEISIPEKEWLEDIALLADGDPNNDIDISGL
ncbi:MAG: hypothetical protein IKR18_08630 [Bacteroidaceae bacterium]|nr:hypothetical protein [Bacteroidaceae bacterium]